MTQHEFPRLAERYYEERLPCGLLIRVTHKPEFAKSYAFFATNYGSLDTKFTLDGKELTTPDGVAHYLEHKMFDMPGANAMQEFSKLGGSPNAFTSYAMTAYYVESTENQRENLDYLLRFVSTPHFTDESVEKERGIIAQEIRMYEDSPDSRLYENLFATLYHSHPIRVPIAGTVQSIGEITAQTLYDCHRAFYDPSNMMLAVAGPLDPKIVVETAKNALTQTSGTVSSRDYGEIEPLTGHLPQIKSQMEVSMPGFSIGFKCEPAKPGRDSLYQELLGDLAADLLVGESTELYGRLYEEGLIDSDFSAGFEGVKGISMLTVSGDSRDPDAVLCAILEEGQRLQKQGGDPILFDRLKKSAFGRRVRELDSFENICYRMCQSSFDGAEYYDFPQLYDTMELREAEEFLARVLTAERACMSVVYPKEK